MDARHSISLTMLAAAVALPLASVTPAHANADKAASVKVEQVSVEALDGKRTGAQITIGTSTAPEFTVFKLSNPTRIVVDLARTDLNNVSMPEASMPAVVRDLVGTQFSGHNGPVARIVVGLSADDVEYQAKARGKSVVLQVHKNQSEAVPAKHSQAAAAQEQQTAVVEINGSDVDEPVAKRLTGVTAHDRDGATILSIKADGMVERYEVEEVTDPPRLVIDLFNVKAKKGLDKALHTSSVGRIRVGLHHDKTRVVVDAAGGAFPDYDVAATGQGLSVLFDARRSESQQQTATVKGFRLEEKKGFMRLRLDVDGTTAVRTVGNSPRSKSISLEGAQLASAEPQVRRYSTGPIESVEIAPDPAGRHAARVNVHFRESVEQSVWQKDGDVLWDVRTKSPASNGYIARQGRAQPRAAGYRTEITSTARELSANRRYRGKRITIDLMDADILNVLRLIADVSGRNIVVGESVSGKITIKLKNVPWDQALDVILKVKGLGMDRRGGIMRIVPATQLQAERRAAAEAARLREESLPTTTRLIPVNYALASELMEKVQSVLTARGKATFDGRTNVIIVNDIRDSLEKAERLVRTLDTQTPQVLIEARMVEASTSFSRSLGIQWGGGLLFSQAQGNPTGLIFPNNVGIVGAADDTPQPQPQQGIFQPSNYVVNVPSRDSTTAVGMNLGSLGNVGFLNARLAAAEANGEAKTVSAPKITTLDNIQASITQGVQIPVVINSGLQGLQTQFINAALQLDVKPHVTADGSVLMEIQISNNTPSGGTDQFGTPSVDTKEAKTQMMVKDGDTAVIGGIYQRTVTENSRQTPFLGKIPLLGWLFRNYATTDDRREMLVFLTPRVINRRQTAVSAGVIE
jgi:type IV pilus assembly protein PilQ